MEGSQSLETQTSDMELMKKMEDDHLRLQRQVRMIQIDRLHRTMGVHPQFRRQDQLLRTLKKEYINLIKDLKIARSGAHKKKDKRMRSELTRALLIRIKTEFDCEAGLTTMHQIDGLLHDNSKEMLSLRKRTNANEGQIEKRRQQSENRLVSMENRLEAAKLRFNAVQYENKKIREEIEHMLKDRAAFNQAWDKLMGALSKGKKFLIDLFESSTLAYDQRDEWCTKLRSLQEKGKMDQSLQVQEMRELQKYFDHEMKLYNFLAKKGIIRINKKQEQKEEEQKIKEEEKLEREYNKHCKILTEIHNYTNEVNTKKIIMNFQDIEHTNFSMYKLLTEYCAENEVLNRELNRVRQLVVDRRDWNEMMEARRTEKLQALRDDLENKKKITNELRGRLEEKNLLLNDTMAKIEEIFKMLDCSLEPFQNLLGNKQPSLRRLNLTLRLITDKIKEHIETVYYYERFIQKKSDKSNTSRLKKYTVHAEQRPSYTPLPINLIIPGDPCPSCVEARWMSRVTDTQEVPFNHKMALQALTELSTDPAFMTSDRVHPLTECRVSRSRLILARTYMSY
ncbi:coiled-coil domain-containing protein 63-like [Galleria mellonella]|uniref:Coiled-coil domain-containing protein 63-like n=1 Tax=Galleria mellonella TaxID=7137 RepID=A0ABM3MCB3_GALME|nr:coiled-coil domain-containing protein 63-like [Galleria mellonella]